MLNRSIGTEPRVLVSWTLALFLALYGCAAKTTDKPQSIAPQSNMAPQIKEQGNSIAPASSAESALDALKRGELPVTPESTPLKDVFFDFDRADLRVDARETLKLNATWLRSHPSTRVEIEGYCDERGTSEYNLALGAKRAQAALDYFAALGVDSARVSATSFGSELQVCREHNEDCWQKNRRDRLVVKTAQTN